MTNLGFYKYLLAQTAVGFAALAACLGLVYLISRLPVYLFVLLLVTLVTVAMSWAVGVLICEATNIDPLDMFYSWRKTLLTRLTREVKP